MERDRAAYNRRQAETFDAESDFFAGPQDRDVGPRLERIVVAAALNSRSRVLDVGTGTGALLPHILGRRPARIEAVDLSSEMLRHAEERYGSGVNFRQADFVDVPGESAFDVIFFNAVFWNLFDRRRALAHAAHLLAPGGRMIISHPMGKLFVRRLREDNPDLLRDDPVDDSLLVDAIEHHGFQIVERVDDQHLYLLVARLGLPEPQ